MRQVSGNTLQKMEKFKYLEAGADKDLKRC